MASTRELAWSPAPAALVLENGSVHVWRIRLDQTSPELHSLSTDERARAERYVFARDRDRFVIARAAVRRVLARYLDGSAESLRFRYGSHGKPILDEDTPLAFNLSHAHERALLAVSRDRALGVDVEWHRAVDIEALATQNFSPAERRELFALPAPARLDAFFRCWTRKEAYVKARGEGLAIPLDGFTVSIGDGPEVALHGADAARWSIRALPIDAGYTAALAVDGAPGELCLWDGESMRAPADAVSM